MGGPNGCAATPEKPPVAGQWGPARPGAEQVADPGPRAAGDLGRRLVPQPAPALGVLARQGNQKVKGWSEPSGIPLSSCFVGEVESFVFLRGPLCFGQAAGSSRFGSRASSSGALMG